jgi:protein-S-isoprenylcysteine O-methyltransferase Ste14
MTRRLLAVVLGVAFLGSHFVLFPAFAIALNTSWGWPRWRSAASEGVGIVLGLAAVAALVHCATMFRSIGRGTPQPLAPPTRLVAAGLYQYSRNPIYAADVALLLAVFLVRGDVMLLLYTLVVTVELHLWIVWREEPVLRGRFGDGYLAYTERVPRWLLGRRSGWR